MSYMQPRSFSTLLYLKASSKIQILEIVPLSNLLAFPFFCSLFLSHKNSTQLLWTTNKVLGIGTLPLMWSCLCFWIVRSVFSGVLSHSLALDLTEQVLQTSSPMPCITIASTVDFHLNSGSWVTPGCSDNFSHLLDPYSCFSISLFLCPMPNQAVSLLFILTLYPYFATANPTSIFFSFLTTSNYWVTFYLHWWSLLWLWSLMPKVYGFGIWIRHWSPDSGVPISTSPLKTEDLSLFLGRPGSIANHPQKGSDPGSLVFFIHQSFTAMTRVYLTCC